MCIIGDFRVHFCLQIYKKIKHKTKYFSRKSTSAYILENFFYFGSVFISKHVEKKVMKKRRGSVQGGARVGPLLICTYYIPIKGYSIVL